MDDIPQIKPKSILEPTPVVQASSPEVHIMRPMSEAGGVKLPHVPKRKKKIFMFLGGFFALIVILGLVVFVGVVVPGMDIYKKAQVLASHSNSIETLAASQDISVIKTEIASIRTDLASFSQSFARVSYLKNMPWVGAYYRDGESATKAANAALDTGDLVIAAIEPYADIIGLKGAKQAASGMENANDRLQFIVSSIKTITPQMGAISDKATIANTELAKIDASRYPVEFRGIKIREKLTKYLSLAEEGTKLLSQSKPLIEAAPYLLGVDSPRTYLLIFQNDSELRPTGGFLSAYSIVEINKGKFKPVSSSDIYILDAKYTPSIAAPDIFRQYLGGIYAANNRFRLRDMNWSPDFKTSMETFVPEAKKAGLTNYDGIITVDTKVLKNLLDVIGTVGVFGLGNFGTQIDPACNCPQFIWQIQNYTSQEGAVVWSQDEPGKIIFAPKNYGKNRKDILGELMNSILANTLGQPKDKMPALIDAGWKSLMGKHVQMYMFDEKAQAALETFNLAGRIQDYQGDYLHVNDANLGGRKSNLYVTSEVTQDISVARDGSVEKTVTITYKNPQKYDGFLNSVLPNWTRVYVPKGSVLIDRQGFDDMAEPYEELGKTVFAGGFKLRPEGVKQVTLKYKLPFKATGSLKLFVQKQGGPEGPLYTINVGKKKEELYLTADQEFSFPL